MRLITYLRAAVDAFATSQTTSISIDQELYPGFPLIATDELVDAPSHGHHVPGNKRKNTTRDRRENNFRLGI